MAKQPTTWIDDTRQVSVSVSAVADYLLDETGAILLDETGANLQAEGVSVTGKPATAWS